MNFARTIDPLASGPVEGLDGGVRPSAVSVVRPDASDRPARSRSSRGSRSGWSRIGAGWVISIVLHAALVWGAAHYLLEREEESVEAPEFVTQLDLRAMTMVERAAREPVFDAQAAPRQGIPEARDDSLISDAAAVYEATPVDPAEYFRDEVAADVTDESAAPKRSLAAVDSRGGFRSTKLPVRRSTIAATPVSSGDGQAHGTAVGGGSGEGAGQSVGVGVPNGTGTQPTTAIAPDAPPRLVEGRDPVYPALARRAGQEGRVECRLAIDDAGHVTTVDIVTSSGHDRLDEAVRTTLLGWRFEPATSNGVPVACTILHGVTFRLVRDGTTRD